MPSSVVPPDRERRTIRRCEKAQKGTGYGSKWKKWLTIYLIAGAIAYLAIYLLFFTGGSGGGRPY